MVDVLRFATAGSVDDGKSSLIGRLLYDSKNLFDDQISAVEKASAQRGSDHLELALLTDGLRAEREQNITIDVAYRYFTTPKRKFIIADTPGHVQYTRNMVTGVSRVDLSVVLVDASKGLLTQSKRHTAVSVLMGVPHIVAAINKMDLVGYDEARFNELAAEFKAFVAKLGQPVVTVIPVSALVGDNVVEPSANMPWYKGETLLDHLESAPIQRQVRENRPFRMFVQTVVRGEARYRALAGRPSGGSLKVGDRVQVLPGREEATVLELRNADGLVPAVHSGEAVTVRLAEDVDVSRGALLVHPTFAPAAADRLKVTLCWMSDRQAKAGQAVMVAHGTRRVPATILSVDEQVNIETLESHPAKALNANDIGVVTIQTAEPIFPDLYAGRSEGGALLLIDPGTLVTVGAAMVTSFEKHENRAEDEAQTVVFAGAGAKALAKSLRPLHSNVSFLDAEELRTSLGSNGSTARDVAQFFNANGHSVVVVDEHDQEPDLIVSDPTDPGIQAAALRLISAFNSHEYDNWPSI